MEAGRDRFIRAATLGLGLAIAVPLLSAFVGGPTFLLRIAPYWAHKLVTDAPGSSPYLAIGVVVMLVIVGSGTANRSVWWVAVSAVSALLGAAALSTVGDLAKGVLAAVVLVVVATATVFGIAFAHAAMPARSVHDRHLARQRVSDWVIVGSPVVTAWALGEAWLAYADVYERWPHRAGTMLGILGVLVMVRRVARPHGAAPIVVRLALGVLGGGLAAGALDFGTVVLGPRPEGMSATAPVDLVRSAMGTAARIATAWGLLFGMHSGWVVLWSRAENGRSAP